MSQRHWWAKPSLSLHTPEFTTFSALRTTTTTSGIQVKCPCKALDNQLLTSNVLIWFKQEKGTFSVLLPIWCPLQMYMYTGGRGGGYRVYTLYNKLLIFKISASNMPARLTSHRQCRCMQCTKVLNYISHRLIKGVELNNDPTTTTTKKGIKNISIATLLKKKQNLYL